MLCCSACHFDELVLVARHNAAIRRMLQQLGEKMLHGAWIMESVGGPDVHGPYSLWPKTRLLREQAAGPI